LLEDPPHDLGGGDGHEPNKPFDARAIEDDDLLSGTQPEHRRRVAGLSAAQHDLASRWDTRQHLRRHEEPPHA
jgi:hypothetical protein